MSDDIMDEKEREVFERIRGQLNFDPMALDDALMEMPFLMMEASEHAVHAVQARELWKVNLAIKDAETDTLIRAAIDREKEKITEKTIASRVLLRVTQSNEQLQFEHHRARAALWQALVDSVRAKESALKNYCALVTSGFLTRDSVYQEQRRKMRQSG